MRVHVHVGTHKTATTSIQFFLREHAEALGQAGVHVPRAGTSVLRPGHHNIGWGLRGDPRFDPAHGSVDELLAELELAGTPNAVISSEDLEYLADNPAALSRLDDALRAAGHVPDYFLFVRRPDEYAVSLYSELRKKALDIPFASFIEHILREGKFVMRGDWSYYFDMDAFARNWSAAAKASPARHDYDAAAAGAGVLPRFLELIGAPAGLSEAARGFGRLNVRAQAVIPEDDRALARLLLERFGTPSAAA